MACDQRLRVKSCTGEAPGPPATIMPGPGRVPRRRRSCTGQLDGRCRDPHLDIPVEQRSEQRGDQPAPIGTPPLLLAAGQLVGPDVPTSLLREAHLDRWDPRPLVDQLRELTQLRARRVRLDRDGAGEGAYTGDAIPDHGVAVVQGDVWFRPGDCSGSTCHRPTPRWCRRCTGPSPPLRHVRHRRWQAVRRPMRRHHYPPQRRRIPRPIDFLDFRSQ